MGGQGVGVEVWVRGEARVRGRRRGRRRWGSMVRVFWGIIGEKEVLID